MRTLPVIAALLWLAGSATAASTVIVLPPDYTVADSHGPQGMTVDPQLFRGHTLVAITTEEPATVGIAAANSTGHLLIRGARTIQEAPTPEAGASEAMNATLHAAIKAAKQSLTVRIAELLDAMPSPMNDTMLLLHLDAINATIDARFTAIEQGIQDDQNTSAAVLDRVFNLPTAGDVSGFHDETRASQTTYDDSKLHSKLDTVRAEAARNPDAGLAYVQLFLSLAIIGLLVTFLVAGRRGGNKQDMSDIFPDQRPQ